MYKAVPAIAVSAAGLTWLLHAQGVIDTTATKGSADQAVGGSTPSTSQTPLTTAKPSTTTTRRRNDDDEGPPPTRSSTTTAAPPSTTATTSNGGQRTIDGPTVENRYGPVQVEVVISGGRITDAKALQYPSDARRSQSINAQALPLLKQQVLEAQSANIDGVSGATYTSESYQQSLQSALDQAGIR